MRIEVDLPDTRLELFFRMEADRMVNAVLRGFEAQRFTVLEQFLNFNRPENGRYSEALNGVTGVVHPIFLHPGGHMRDHAYWDRASMLRIYDDYFVPGNATLALVGAVTVEEVTRLAVEYFGRLPRGPEPPARMDVEVEPPPGGTVRLDWLEPLGSSQVTVRYRIPGVGHPERPAFDVIAGLLGGSGGLGASASQSGSPNRLSITARASSDAELPALERVAHDAVERLRRGDIDPARLARVQRELRHQWLRLRSDRGSLASEIGAFSVTDEWRTLRSFYEQRANTSADEIQRLAERYLVPWNRVIGTTRVNPTPPAAGHLTATPARAK
jgi:predicted Zn-dependent peptidase